MTVAPVSLVTAAALALHLAPASAQEAPQGFSLGVGLAATNGYLIGEDGQATALPILRYDSNAFSVGLPEGLRITAFERGALRFSGLLAPRLSAIDLSDAAELDGLDRQITLDGGLQVDYSLAAQTRLTFRAVTELTDEQGGQEVSLGLSQMLRAGRVPVILGAGLVWQSEDLAGYLYGVKPSEATASRAAYAPGEVVVPYLSIGSVLPINDKLRLVATLRADFLPDEVTQSPIVDEEVSLGAVVGLTWSF